MLSPKSIFISHGGGPLPLLGDAGHGQLVDTLKSIAARVKTPDSILLVSAHWEEDVPTITSGKNPSLIYDYYGFPEESYSIDYPCPGNPALAKEVYDSLQSVNITAKLDEKRGFDHGMFVPLKIMYPEANIPCVQLSLTNDLDASHHLNVGAALRNIAQKNVLVIGSGFSFHNMRAFFSSDNPESTRLNHAFEEWLKDTCSNVTYSEDERKQRLTDWAKAPGARFCHPREEHLLPLHVCYGLVQSPSAEYVSINILNKSAGMILW
jgi:aromatic ring-opening dioxygenase catalytic subunit (LigB family)